MDKRNIWRILKFTHKNINNKIEIHHKQQK